jgi:hypothetical protein
MTMYLISYILFLFDFLLFIRFYSFPMKLRCLSEINSSNIPILSLLSSQYDSQLVDDYDQNDDEYIRTIRTRKFSSVFSHFSIFFLLFFRVVQGHISMNIVFIILSNESVQVTSIFNRRLCNRSVSRRTMHRERNMTIFNIIYLS